MSDDAYFYLDGPILNKWLIILNSNDLRGLIPERINASYYSKNFCIAFLYQEGNQININPGMYFITSISRKPQIYKYVETSMQGVCGCLW